MKRLLVCALLAGCGGAPAPRSTVGNTATATPPTTAPPILAREQPDGPFTATGLPAISADGNNVVIAYVAEDGARGEPNLAVLVKDRADATMHRQVVLEPDQPAAPWQPNLDAANAYLGRLHAERNLVPLAPLAVSGERTGAGEGLEVSWREGQVTVRAGGTVVLERSVAEWTIAPTPDCANPSFLAAAWGDAARELVLLEISYKGNDSCWEPDSQYHVVSW